MFTITTVIKRTKSYTSNATITQIVLSHDQGTIHAEMVCVEMRNFYMAALMFLTGHGIKTRTHACA